MAAALTGCGGGGGGGAEVADGGIGDGATGTTTGGAAPSTSNPRSSSGELLSGTGYAFGSRLDAYAAGTLVTVASPQQMDDTIRRCYDAWKRENLVRTDNIAPGGYVIKFANSPTVRTVSEGMGMGMILMSVMAGHDPNARTYFDGLFKVVRARPAYGPRQPALMDWRLWMDGRSGGDGWPATDGDLDIALGLLMADRQWGSDGQVNYKQEAINTINAIKEWFMYPDGRLRGRPSENTSRTSDFMFGHFRAFKKATGDAIWDAAVEKQIAILQALQANHSPGIGLVPDFCKDTNTSPAPSPGRNPGVGDGTVTDGDYFFNACRCPWRYGSDYVMTGDERMREICRKLVGFLQADSGGNPGSIATGYKLNGTAISRAYSAGGIVGPVLAGAMVDPSFQTFLNNLWSWNTNNFTTHYYDSELQLIPMLLASGNWWTP